MSKESTKLMAPPDIVAQIRSCKNDSYRRILYNIFTDTSSPWLGILAKALHAETDLFGKPIGSRDLVLLGLEYHGAILEQALIDRMTHGGSLTDKKTTESKESKEAREAVDEVRNKRFKFLSQYILMRQKISYWTIRIEEARVLNTKLLKEGDRAQASLYAPSNFSITANDIRIWNDECSELHKALSSLSKWFSKFLKFIKINLFIFEIGMLECLLGGDPLTWIHGKHFFQ